ncbi:MAG: GNAT family N-acetyltransferase [Bdellovibrionales bacterium]|nr:GNAT family N-acetyltransferase [Bdellovibrionales bacterium]
MEIRAFESLTTELFGQLEWFEQEIFERPMTREDLESELSDRPDLLVLVAFEEEKPCGFKVGYRYHSDREYFYSWSGGVVPHARGKGVASALMLHQHRVAKERGYRYVRTQTKNRYRDMLILNLKNGFEITGVYKKLREHEHGIILEKELAE